VEDRFIFAGGVVAGYILATVVGFVLGKIRAAKGKMGASGRKQSVKQDTDKTPIEVVRSSRAAIFTWLFWLLAFVGLVAFLGYMAYLLFTR
jgi:hypothetical protein